MKGKTYRNFTVVMIILSFSSMIYVVLNSISPPDNALAGAATGHGCEDIRIKIGDCHQNCEAEYCQNINNEYSCDLEFSNCLYACSYRD